MFFEFHIQVYDPSQDYILDDYKGITFGDNYATAAKNLEDFYGENLVCIKYLSHLAEKFEIPILTMEELSSVVKKSNQH